MFSAGVGTWFGCWVGLLWDAMVVWKGGEEISCMRVGMMVQGLLSGFEFWGKGWGTDGRVDGLCKVNVGWREAVVVNERLMCLFCTMEVSVSRISTSNVVSLSQSRS